jgi:hypothetical protein
MLRFVHAVNHKARYSKDVLKMASARPLRKLSSGSLFSTKGAESLPSSPTRCSPKATVEAGSSYFCSELVADLWQHCGLMSTGCRASSFWPSDFGTGAGGESWLSGEAELGPETLLLWRRPEAGEARPAPLSSKRISSRKWFD